MQILENRVAIITGGTGALGRAVVENFLIAGAKAAVPYVVDAEVPILQKHLGDRFPASEIFLKKADVSDEAQIAKFVADVTSKWSKIDILVTCAIDLQTIGVDLRTGNGQINLYRVGRIAVMTATRALERHVTLRDPLAVALQPLSQLARPCF